MKNEEFRIADESANAMRRQQTAANKYSRRGSSYLFFMGPIMLVAVIGLTALMATRVQLRSAERTRDSTAARFYAQSGIELGILDIRKNPNWWQSAGAWATNVAIGNGTYSLTVVVAPDVIALADGTDPARLISTGRCGKATHVVQVDVDTRGFVPGTWQRTIK